MRINCNIRSRTSVIMNAQELAVHSELLLNGGGNCDVSDIAGGRRCGNDGGVGRYRH